jgi:hypothetical protein
MSKQAYKNSHQNSWRIYSFSVPTLVRGVYYCTPNSTRPLACLSRNAATCLTQLFLLFGREFPEQNLCSKSVYLVQPAHTDVFPQGLEKSIILSLLISYLFSKVAFTNAWNNGKIGHVRLCWTIKDKQRWGKTIKKLERSAKHNDGPSFRWWAVQLAVHTLIVAQQVLWR